MDPLSTIEIGVRLIALVVLLVFSAVFSATETAFTSLSLVQVSQLASKTRRGRLIKKLTEKPDNMLTTILLGNNLVNIGATSIATELTIKTAGESMVAVVSLLLTLIVLIFAEVTPKRIAMIHNEWIAKQTVVMVWILSTILMPIVRIIRLFSKMLSWPFTGKKNNTVTMENLLHMVKIAEESGVVEEYKKSMVQTVFTLDEIDVEAIMTRRQDIFSLSEEISINEAIELIKENPFSRIPIYRKEPELITGIVLTKDLLKAKVNGAGTKALKEYKHLPIFVSEVKKLSELVSLFKTNHLKMVVILDEYGGLSGIVTQEDLVEEIFGDFYDEDEEKEESLIIQSEVNRWEIKGEAPIHFVNEQLKIAIPPSRYSKTIAGFLIEKLDQIPTVGMSYLWKGYKMKVLKMDKNRIAKILVLKTNTKETEKESFILAP